MLSVPAQIWPQSEFLTNNNLILRIGCICQETQTLGGHLGREIVLLLLQFGIYVAGTISENLILKIFLMAMELQEKGFVVKV